VPTSRGWAAVGAGLTLWVAARFLGSNDLHMIAAGIVAVPFLAALFVRWTRVRLDVRRSLSSVRVFPGTRVVVSLTVENLGRGTVPFLLMEDTLPAPMGRQARLVLTGVPSRNSETVTYSLVCRQRGHLSVGPLTIYLTDPFALARARVRTLEPSELIVYPQVEDVEARGLATQGASAGESAVRHLYRSAAEFYTMREYVHGDDLRRIHWASVARTGRLMIRQDESTRRATATLFVDTRSAALGMNGAPGFERAVSAAATVGRALIRRGFSLSLATADSGARPVSEDRLLEILAATGPVRAKSVEHLLTGLRRTAVSDATLAIVAAPPHASEVAGLSRLGAAFGRKLAVFVYPVNLSNLTPQAAAEYEGRATAARATLQRSGWEVYLVEPNGRLKDVWQSTPTRKLPAAASSS
jgi:uncharacterized protein (DUF58 family)